MLSSTRAILAFLVSALASCGSAGVSGGATDATLRPLDTDVTPADRDRGIQGVRRLWSANERRDTAEILRASVGRQPLDYLRPTWSEQTFPVQLASEWILRSASRDSVRSDSVFMQFELPYDACIATGHRKRATLGFLVRPSLSWRVEEILTTTSCM